MSSPPSPALLASRHGSPGRGGVRPRGAALREGDDDGCGGWAPASWRASRRSSACSAERIARHRLPHCQLVPDVGRLVRHLHSHNVPTPVATSNKQQFMDAKLSSYTELRASFGTSCAAAEERQARPRHLPRDDQPLSRQTASQPDAGDRRRGDVGTPTSPLVPPRQLSGASLVLGSLVSFHPEHYVFPPF